MELSNLESHMAWHGGLYRHGRLLCTPVQLEAWRHRLPSWIEEEHARLDSGELPSRPTLRALLESGSQYGSLSDKTPQYSPNGSLPSSGPRGPLLPEESE